MTSLSEDLTHVLSELKGMHMNSKALDKMFNVVKSRADVTTTDLDDFQRLASDLPYVGDRDYGALLLEQEAYRRFGSQRVFLLKAARERAAYCAATSTGAGEGLSRSSHVQRIDKELT